MDLNEELSAAYASLAPSQAARNAVRSAMEVKGAHVRRTRRIRRSVSLMALTAGGVAVLVGLGPTAYAVYRLRQVAGSVSDAQTAEIDDFEVRPDGTMSPSGRTLYDHGKWRFEQGTGYRIWQDGRLWRFDPAMHRIETVSMPDGPAAHNPTGFGVKSMISDMAGWSWRQKIEVGEGSFEGKPVTWFSITNPDVFERMVVLADPKTSMPVAFKQEVNRANGWRLIGIARARFNQPLNPMLFSTRFPSNLPVVDLDKAKAEFKRSIERPLGTFTWQGQAVALRYVAVNERGSVFILFTDGETKQIRQRIDAAVLSTPSDGKPHEVTFTPFSHPDWNVSDSLGQTYLRSSGFQPYVGCPNPRLARGIVLSDGEILQGQWLIPESEGPWTARTITLKLDGPAKGEQNTYRLPLPRPNSAVVPDWMQAMGMAPSTENDVLREELQLRRPGLERTDPQLLISNCEQELRVDSEEEHQGRGPWAKGDLYFGLYKGYSSLGDRNSALKYLNLASGEPYATPELKQALKKERRP